MVAPAWAKSPAKFKNGPEISYYKIAVAHLKDVESYVDTMYYCSAGAPTIFWGKVIDPSKKEYYENLSKKEQQELFQKDFLKRYEEIKKKYPSLKHQRELLAATLLYWNIGTFGKNLDTAIKEYNLADIEKFWKKYIYYKNKKTKRKEKSSGLVARREFEINLFKGKIK